MPSKPSSSRSSPVRISSGCADRDPVDLGVGVHDGAKTGELDRCGEWPRVHFPQFPGAGLGRRHVLSAFGHGVAEEVLRRRDDAITKIRSLQTFRDGHAQG